LPDPASPRLRPPSPGEAGGDQTVPCDDPLAASGTGLREDTEPEWDKMSLEIGCGADYVDMEASRRLARLPGEAAGKPRVNPVVPAAAPPVTCVARHECLSVHTLIQDLDKHQYHRSAWLQGEERQDVQWKQGPSQASHVVVSLKAAVGAGGLNDSLDSGVSSSGSVKLCAEASCPDAPPPRGVVRRLVSLELEGFDCKLTRVGGRGPVSVSAPPPPRSPLDPAEADAAAETEPFHADRRQFEEEEEELEDIWNRTKSYRQSICSDIMYQPHQEEEAQAASCGKGEPPPLADTPPSPARPQAVLYRKLVTASAPNLLVAKFKLPPSIQSLLGYDRDKSSGEELPPVAKGDRRSWAAFLSGEPACKSSSSSSAANETLLDRVMRPDMEDIQRYVYQYGDEEEEEEEEGAKVGEEEKEEVEEEENKACLQVRFEIHSDDHTYRTAFAMSSNKSI